MSSASRRTASSTGASARWWPRRSADRCSTPSASRAACASAPARPARSSSICRWRSPGPGRPRRTSSVCHYCGVGCRIDYQAFGDTLVKVTRNEANEVTFGNHCRKGRFGFNYVLAHDRLLRGASGRRQRRRTTRRWTRASRTRRPASRSCPAGTRAREMAVFVSPRLTNEEIYLAQKFARVALRTHNVTSFSHLVNRDLFAPSVVSTATYQDVAAAQALVVVGSEPGRRALRRGPDCQAGDPQRRQAGVHRARRQPHRAFSPRSSSAAGPTRSV